MKLPLVLLALAAVAGLSFSLQNVSSCQVINVSDTYVLTANLFNATIIAAPTTACIHITASDVLLDCNGFSLTDDPTGSDHTGINVDGANNVTIVNCASSLYDQCIALRDSNASLVTGNNVTNCSFAGIYVDGTSSGNSITGNDAASSNYGIWLGYSPSANLVSGNTANGNDNDGIRVEFSNSNAVQSNELFGNRDGVGILGGAGNVVDGNTAYNNSVSGYFGGGDNTTVTGNTAYSNDRGFRLLGPMANSLVSNNTAYGNDAYGFEVDGTAGNNTYDLNTAFGNGDGFFIRTDNDTFTNNNASFNDFDGIELQGAQGNILSDNFVQENGQFDLNVVPYEDADCGNFIANMVASGGGLLQYYNSPQALAGGTYPEIVLCDADNSSISGVTISGSSSLDNNGVLVINS
ncbi:MAG: NosD domain-containing protein, partial [Candidatus Micrarchaeota archaeon]